MRDYSGYTDEQLLSRMKDSDELAFATLYDRYAPVLLQKASKQLSNLQAAEEIIHDVFLNTWNLRKTADIQNIEAYLRQSLKYRIINYVVRKKEPAFFSLFETISGSPYLADQQVREKELSRLIIALIEALPEKRRQVFARHYLQHQSTHEIARDLRLSEKTVQNQISLGLNYLRARLTQLFTLLSLLFQFS